MDTSITAPTESSSSPCPHSTAARIEPGPWPRPKFPRPPVDLLTSFLSQPHPDADQDRISNPSDDSVDRPFAHPFRQSPRPPPHFGFRYRNRKSNSNHMSLPPRPFGHARGTSFGKPLNAGGPVLKPDIFTFTPPNLPKFPMTQTPSQRACSGLSRVEAATMAAVITRAFHTDSGHETPQQAHDHSTFFPVMSSAPAPRSRTRQITHRIS